MKRDIRIKVEYVVTLDDEGISLPALHTDLIEQVARVLTPNAAYLHPGAKISAGLTRASSQEIRNKAKRAKEGASSEQASGERASSQRASSEQKGSTQDATSRDEREADPAVASA